ncbi:MAG: peptide chain release factor 3 [Cytophagaceae bacterium]|jgi:peptide chain release factor 3|nr:peptide chain release factor 3 [Cytophagaceae bacterium]
MTTKEEISRRRTFGIISHPDAGKTTLTEKLLLFGGAIQTAGAVKSNKITKSATSDFMEIERQRGISVATSVMAFDYNGYRVNLLDTPGHKDFAEDTYRTLTAVDSVILVIDCVKGVEMQTEKLMEVCRMRNTPVIVFINKMDRDGQDPFDLLDELESKLNIKVRPLSWPISMGKTFQGVYNLYSKNLHLFRPNKTAVEKDVIQISDLQDPLFDEYTGKYAEQCRKDVELIEGVYEPFNRQQYLDGTLAPVFFGSAVNNFGVKELLEAFLEIAPPPKEKESNARQIQPMEEKFSGFVFKIHANLDPRHRDRIAFIRICSGKLVRNNNFHHVRLGKKLKFNTPVNFMAQEKNVIEEAYAGDVVGLYDTGNFKIGDTLTEGEDFMFKGIPNFSPELFREVINKDPMKAKQLEKGLMQLTEEGVAQLFIQQPGNRKIIGTVGELQFEVIQHRLLHEYGATCDYHSMSLYKACWVSSTNQKELERFCNYKASSIARDKDDNIVFLADTRFTLNSIMEIYKDLNFSFISEHNSKSFQR